MARYNVCDVTILRTEFYNHYEIGRASCRERV